ncbi:MAG: hypothetical protein ACYC6L_07330 [Anaerolineae bacterium]
MIKLIMTWNILEGKETEYLEFLNRDFVKLFDGMGIQPTDAWYQVWGHGQQVLAGGVTPTYEAMEKALSSDEWKQFKTKLLEYVTDFQAKVVEGTGGFQL